MKIKKSVPSVEIKKIEVKKKSTTEVEAVGNCGYIIKDGVPFSGVSSVKVKIEVSPAREGNSLTGQTPP